MLAPLEWRGLQAGVEAGESDDAGPELATLTASRSSPSTAPGIAHCVSANVLHKVADTLNDHALQDWREFVREAIWLLYGASRAESLTTITDLGLDNASLAPLQLTARCMLFVCACAFWN